MADGQSEDSDGFIWPINTAFRETFRNFWPYFSAAKWAVMIYVGVEIAFYFVPESVWRALVATLSAVLPSVQPSVAEAVVAELYYLLYVFLVPAMAIWIRVAHDGSGEGDRDRIYPLGPRERRLVVVYLGLSLLFFVTGTPFIIAGHEIEALDIESLSFLFLGGALSILGGFYFAVHFIPFAVGTAVGHRITVATSFRMMWARAWWVFLQTAVAFLVLSLVFMVAGLIVGGGTLLVGLETFQLRDGSLSDAGLPDLFSAYDLFFLAFQIALDLIGGLFMCVFYTCVYRRALAARS